jgi:hypothetical protein
LAFTSYRYIKYEHEAIKMTSIIYDLLKNVVKNFPFETIKPYNRDVRPNLLIIIIYNVSYILLYYNSLNRLNLTGWHKIDS